MFTIEYLPYAYSTAAMGAAALAFSALATYIAGLVETTVVLAALAGAVGTTAMGLALLPGWRARAENTLTMEAFMAAYGLPALLLIPGVVTSIVAAVHVHHGAGGIGALVTATVTLAMASYAASSVVQFLAPVTEMLGQSISRRPQPRTPGEDDTHGIPNFPKIN